MSIKVRYPNDDKARQAMERDRKYWSEVYRHNPPSICPDTRDKLDVSICARCDFKRRFAGRDVQCALAHGDGWIRRESP